MTDAALFDLHEPATEGETPEDRTRRLARIRKRKERQRDAAAALRNGATTITFDAYQGTQDDLALICAEGGFDQVEEAMTLLLRNVADLARRDSHAFKQLVKFPSRKDAAQ